MTPRCLAHAGALLLVLLGLALASATSFAQIKEPGAHPAYSVELEPHLLVDWSDEFWGSDGLGIGARVSIPVIDNGPITTINNNLAVGFGFDWAHFGGSCWNWGPFAPGEPNPPGPYLNGYDCSGNNFWFPAVAQWNFFLTPVISVFGEAGFAIRYSTWSADVGCGNAICRRTGNDLGVEPLFFGGARFLVAKSFGITARLGWPYLSVGASFLF
jgi:hypothetical protein